MSIQSESQFKMQLDSTGSLMESGNDQSSLGILQLDSLQGNCTKALWTRIFPARFDSCTCTHYCIADCHYICSSNSSQ